MTGMATLLDLIQKNNADPVVGIIDETAKAVPEIARFGARTITGIGYDTLVRTEMPIVGFRAINQGVDFTWGSSITRRVNTFILNPRWAADKALADASEDGPEGMMADEALVQMNAAFLTVGRQIYYGIEDDPNKGFPGLGASVKDSMTLNAGGTTAGTGSSVWAVKFGVQGVRLVLGQDGDIKPSEVRVQDVLDNQTPPKPYTAYVQEILARIGLQVGNLNGLGVIRNLTEDTGKGLTDALLARLYAKFPVAMKPDAFFMSQRSLAQLQASRTATNATGAEAPFPSEAFGVPIVPTDSIKDTETLTVFA